MDETCHEDMAAVDPAINNLTTPPYHEAVPPQHDVDEFLRKKRKVREHKACYPCRQRKVKCDLTRPCQTCRDRDHPELCSYHPPNKRQQAEAVNNHDAQIQPKKELSPAGAGTVTIGRGEFDMLCRKLTGLENSIADLRRELRRNENVSQSPVFNHDSIEHRVSKVDPPIGNQQQRRPTYFELHGLHTKNDAGEPVHLGGSSIPATLYALGQGHSDGSQLEEMLGKTTLPLFGLDNASSTYPFVDLWGLPHGSLARAQELANALPSDEELVSLVRLYKEWAYVILAGISSPEDLEAELSMFMLNRSAHASTNEGVTEQEIYGKSYTWLALLFAVLAAGAQCSLISRKERELTSQVYICCSFECLRFTNFLSQVNLETIQALVVIGNVLTNNMNAGTAWSFHGLTIRIAQSIGLHQSCPPKIPVEVVFPRSKVWWAIVWLDSLLSIGYDRPSSSMYLEMSRMPMPQQFGSVSPYHSSMYRLSKLVLDIVRDRALPLSAKEKYAYIVAHREAILEIMRDSAEYLRDSRKCKSLRETLEHWALYLHTSYNMSELCRPAIGPNADPEIERSFKQSCVDNLINTLEAYLGLNNITSNSKHSWASLHRALSSALLLGILGEHDRTERARAFVIRFIAILQELTSSLDRQEMSGPVSRGLAALKKLHFSDDLLSRASLGDAESFRTDGSSAFTPTTTDGVTFENEDASPHTLLNSILWGSNGFQGSEGQSSV